MELIIPAPAHKKAAWDYRQEHIDRGEGWIHGSAGFILAENYESWLEDVTRAQTEAPPDFVTGSVYFALVNGNIVGTIALRYYLNESLLNTGGHIGYGVRPCERRKGYGAQMLALVLEKCRDRGMDRVLVTCDWDNTASAKTILKNGGVFENEFCEENGNRVRRYWISL